MDSGVPISQSRRAPLIRTAASPCGSFARFSRLADLLFKRRSENRQYVHRS